jgi:hypothetical protein
MSLVTIENEQYRRNILDLLNEDTDYEMSELILIQAMAELGNPISRDRLLTQLQWLKEQGLIEVNVLAGIGISTAKLTRFGQDVALGHTKVPNIARKMLL